MADEGPAAGGQDMGRAVFTALTYGLSMSATAVVFPLLALDVGMPAPVVGLFTAVSAGAQLLTRFLLPWLLSRVPDRTLMVVAFLCTGLSAGTLLLSTTAAAFVVAQALQGSGRALFWTSSQTHVARAPGMPFRRLAQVQVAGHSGALAGPIIAGSFAAVSLRLGLWVTVVACLVGIATASSLLRRPPYLRSSRGSRRGLWRRPGVMLGCWTSVCAGGWRGMLESFVPVVLVTAGLGAASIGWLVAVADAATMAVTVWLARTRRERLTPLVQVSALTLLAGSSMLPLVAAQPILAGLALALAGAGAGFAGVLGPAIVNGEVEPAEQGRAIALAGTYRAASRLAGPSVLASAGSVVAVPLAMVVAGVGVVLPVLGLSRRSAR